VLLCELLEVDVVVLSPLFELINRKLLEVCLLLALLNAFGLVLTLALRNRLGLASRLRDEHQLELPELELDLLDLLGNGGGGAHL